MMKVLRFVAAVVALAIIALAVWLWLVIRATTDQ
jgi:hypothetical protein